MSRAQCNSGEEPRPGDLIEIFRHGYQHWAVYIGDGDVVHLTGQSGLGSVSGSVSGMSVGGGTATVRREKLEDVVGTNKWKINNNMDNQRKPRPADVIVKEACSLVGGTESYCVFSRNCEHFATQLRYGRKWSRQVIRAIVSSVAVGIATPGFVGLALVSVGVVGLAAYLARR